MHRRDFIKLNGLTAAGLGIGLGQHGLLMMISI